MATRFITVSIEIMHDSNLNQSQKFIYAEIEQLTQMDKGCIASNKHFSELIGITKENVSKNINDLEKKGYVKIEMVKGSRNHIRTITLTTLARPPYQSSKTPLSKQQETKENKTTNRTTNRTKELKTPDWIDKEIWDEWVQFRKEMKRTLTQTTIKRQLKMLEQNKHLHKQIIEQSIMNGWTGLFPLKNTQPFGRAEEGSLMWALEQDRRSPDVIDAQIKEKR